MAALVHTPSAVDRLIAAAKAWAEFQAGDSLEDQRTDHRLHAQAIEARERLLAAIERIA